MTQQSRISAFIEELRRRRVFRVAAFYGGIAFVIVQIIDGTFEVMGIPAWVSRLLNLKGKRDKFPARVLQVD